jgi:hypothetical protein
MRSSLRLENSPFANRSRDKLQETFGGQNLGGVIGPAPSEWVFGLG